MAWTTTSDFTVGHVVTAAEWNASLGASGNTQYLYDRLNTPALGATTAARSLDVVYQNTTGKIMLPIITVNCLTAACYFKCGSTNTTGTTLAQVNNPGTVSAIVIPTTFIVPPNYYYTASSGIGAPALIYWVENQI